MRVARMSRSGLRHAPGLLSLVLLPALARPASAYYYYYSSSCGNACSQAVGTSSYSSCYNACLGCLGYWYSCYSYFQPYFNGNTFTNYDCNCYWPWWSWTLLAIGLALMVGGLVYGIVAWQRKKKWLKEQQEQYQAQMAQGGYPPEGPYPPPGPDGMYPAYPPYPGGPPAGYAQGAPPPMYNATATGYPVQPPPPR